MTKHTPTPWVNGYGEGITGPTTPAIGGPTVSEQIDHDKWSKAENKKKHPYPYGYHTVISKGMATVAIIPTLPDPKSEISQEEGKANAEFITRACNSHDDLLEACKEAISYIRGHNDFEEYHTPKCERLLEQAIAKAEVKDE